MALVKTAFKAAGTALQTGAEKVLRNLPVEQADFIAKTLNFKTGSPEDIFIRGGGLHTTDGPGIINSIQRGEAQDLGQHITNAVQGDPAALNEIARFSDNGTNQVTEDTIKANGLKQANANKVEPEFQPQQPFQQPPQPPLDRLNPIAINHRANLPAGIFNRPVQAQRQPFREMDMMSELTDEFQPIGQYVGEVPSSQEGLSVEFFQPGDDRSLSFTDSFVSDFQPGDDRSLSIREQESQEGLAGGFFQPGDDLSRDSLAGEPIPGILGLEPDELESIPESVEFYERGDERRTRKPRSDIDQPRPHVRERNRNAREIRRQIEEERRSLEENDRRMRDERRQQERELGDDITEIRNLVDSASESGTSV